MLRRSFLATVASILLHGIAKGYVDPPGYHRHRCKKDGFIWSHKPGESHYCPVCGIEQRIIYQGQLSPTVASPPVQPKSSWEH